MKKTAVFLNSPVSVLKNVGQRREAAFIKCSIASVSDLLNHTPLRYLDRTRITGLSDITEEGHYVFHGRVVKISEIPRKMLRVFIEDEKGGAVLLWFRVFQHIKKSISEGYFLFGAGDASFYKEGLQFAHPEIHMTKDERVEIPPEFRGFLPVYPISEAMRSNGIQNRMLRKIIKDALERLETDSCEEIPEIIRRKRLYPPLKEVYRKVHFPHEKHEMNLINRLKYSEIFIFLYKLAQFRRDNLVKGFACNNSRSAINMFLSRLGFKLTSAQEKVLDEIKSDMFSERRMYRLLQGDVGSGKTVIAALAALIAKYSGRQTVLMAPTSVLAEQHYDTFRKIFEYIGFHTILITGSLDDKEKTIAETAVSDGSADIIIGTHAAVSPSLRYHNLGLVIVDEQHRFGVSQRLKLVAKGNRPDILVMSATPIPRTMAHILYGDLDISVIDTLPPGRKSPSTHIVPPRKINDMHFFIKERVKMGGRAFFVFPSIEDSPNNEKRALIKGFKELEEIYHGIPVAMAHGRMDKSEMREVISGFRSGLFKILASTTIVEVGLHVPEADIMVIEGAENFGLSQLHQLRGRVGRSDTDSYCLLIPGTGAEPKAMERLRLFSSENDGFRIAEADFKLRGPGDMTGLRQSGLPEFRFINLYSDAELISEAKADVEKVVTGHYECSREEKKKIEEIIRLSSYKEITMFGS